MIDYLKQIKNIREDKDLTTTQMGNLLGMSHQNYTRIENGQQRLSVDTFIKICAIFKVDPAIFLEKKTKNYKLIFTDDELKIIESALKICLSKIEVAKKSENKN